MSISHIIQSFISFFCPRYCLICEQYSTQYYLFCDSCIQAHYPEKICIYCGKSCSSNSTSAYCSTYCKEKVNIPIIYAIPYHCPIGEYTHKIKKYFYLHYIDGFSQLLLKRIRQYVNYQDIDGIVFVPLHKNTLRRRKFNQSACIAKIISKALDIPILDNIIEKTTPSISQKLLSKKQRKHNLQHCFTVLKKGRQEKLILIDDIYTTGSTCNIVTALLSKYNYHITYHIVLSRVLSP